jgi:hypothetical protein
MQVRAMKGVEVVRYPLAGADPQLGLWLGLNTLVQLPLAGAARIDLWRCLLRDLEPAAGAVADDARDDCRAALLAALIEAELVEACSCLEVAAWQEGCRHWQMAIADHDLLLRLRPDAAGATAGLVAGLIQVLARFDQALTHRQWLPPMSPRQNALVHGFAAELLQRLDALDQPLPAWYAVVAEGLRRRGAQALLLQVSAPARRQGIALLLRLVRQVPAAAAWIKLPLERALLALLAELQQSSDPAADLQALLQALADLSALGQDSADSAAIDQALALAQGCLDFNAEVAPSWDELLEPADSQAGCRVDAQALRALVHEWLDDHPPADQPVMLELVWIPGARPLPHGPGQLALNLAAVLPAEDQRSLEPALAAFFEPLLQARRAEAWRLRQPLTSLLDSLRHAWAGAAVLSGAECDRLAAAEGLWQRWAGPGVLAAPRIVESWPPATLEPAALVVAPSEAQLRALRSWLLEPEPLQDGLQVMRRHHHDPLFLQERAAGRGDPLDALCALHLQEGFYASTAAPWQSLQFWAQGSLATLALSQWLLEPQPATGAWWLVLQDLVQRLNRVPDLVTWPGEAVFYRWLAGQEVLLVSPLAAEVEAQHRSGRAFALFHDLPIAPYGLRVLAAPASRYPARPAQGFEASLAATLEAVDALARQGRFGVFLSVAGAYDLPLCRAVRDRHGAACLAIGPSLHARFGIEQSGDRDWSGPRRRADRWLRIC